MTSRREPSFLRGSAALTYLWARDKRICHLCDEVIARRSDASRDHIIPWSREATYGQIGGYGFENMKLAHKSCNNIRDRMSVEDARAYIRDLRSSNRDRLAGIPTPRPRREDYEGASQ